jgi:hypothetical protein
VRFCGNDSDFDKHVFRFSAIECRQRRRKFIFVDTAMIFLWIVAILDCVSPAPVVTKWHYSILDDTRTSNWPSQLDEVSSDSTGLIKIRSPLLNISISVDFSEPRDIDLLQALFIGPVPGNIIVQSSHGSSSRASAILGRCFDTIAFDEEGELDIVRVRDFINSLFLLAELHPDSPMDGTAGKRITEKAAILICKLYTQQFSKISEWIDLFQKGAIDIPDSGPSHARSITINGLSFPATVPIPNVLQSLVAIQHEAIRRIRKVYDEL